MKYEEAKMRTRKEAEECGHTMFLHRDSSSWLISRVQFKDWLYMARPDGLTRESEASILVDKR